VRPKTRWARAVDGAYIAYQAIGEGPLTLVVIHGWISHQEVYWEEPRYGRFMRRLSQGMRVLTFDKRGTGMSDRIGRAPDLETRMDDVRAVLDAESIDRAALLGWGSGGPALALFFAATHPERTVAVCTDSEILQLRTADYRWAPDEQEDERVLETLVRTWGDADEIDEFLSVGFGEANVPSDDPDFVAWCAKFARFAATPGSYAAFHRMWNDTDIREVLSTVQAPTLVVYKTESPFWGGRDHAAYLAKRIPGARLEGVAGSSAVVWMEEPEPLVSTIERFLTSVSQEEADLDRVSQPSSSPTSSAQHRLPPGSAIAAGPNWLPGITRPFARCSPATEARRSTLPETASSHPSTGPHARCGAPTRSSRRSNR
jgi:pimeloyl-ACP methyl ester carboxylesterase